MSTLALSREIPSAICMLCLVSENASKIVDPSRPNDTSMRQKTNPSLIQVMACRLFGAKPLPSPILFRSASIQTKKSYLIISGGGGGGGGGCA